MGMKLVTNRDVTVSGTTGNSINFKKGVPAHVPDHFIEECMKASAIPANGEEVPVKKVLVAEDAPSGVERKQRILDAMDTMVVLNERGSFSANQFPKLSVLEKTAGFIIDTRELEELWRAFDIARKSGGEIELPKTVADSAPVITEDEGPVIESTEEAEDLVVADEGADNGPEKVEQEAEEKKGVGGQAGEGAEESAEPSEAAPEVVEASRNDMMAELKKAEVEFPGNISNVKLKELYLALPKEG